MPVSSNIAFQLGYRAGRKARSFLTAREALTDHPSILDGGNVAEFLNGHDDGVRRDAFRYGLIRSTKR